MDDTTKYCDALIDYDAAARWAVELFPMSLDQLTDELLPIEPALVAIAINLTQRVERRLTAEGLSAAEAKRAGDQIAHACLVCAEVARRGYRQYLAEHEEETGNA